MNAFVPYLAALHIEELREDACLRRRAKLSQHGQPRVSAWRRGLGGALASAARSLDPSVAADRPARQSSKSGVGRALAS